LWAEELEIDIEDASHKLLSILAFKAVDEKRRAGLAGEALAAYLLTNVDLSFANNWGDIINGAINKGWGAGRDIESKNQEKYISRVYYSSVMDQGTCSECEKKDGVYHELGDPAFATPNPDCLGCNRCRCMNIYIARAEIEAA
jgi:hypothetical protein